MTKYQDQVFTDLKEGARLHCTEGYRYKTWLSYPDGKKRTIRRDSAETVCQKKAEFLLFGRFDGIAHVNQSLGKDFFKLLNPND
jgi:hypothetical protein